MMLTYLIINMLLRPILNCYSQDEELLVEMIKPMIQEPDYTKPYNLSTSLKNLLDLRKYENADLSLEMEEYYLKNINNGFFIEAGAAEGKNLTKVKLSLTSTMPLALLARGD